MRIGSKRTAREAAIRARILIVEDEAHARRYLRELLDTEPQVEVVGECSNGAEGLGRIRELSPDIVFLDIQMPELDGLGMIDQISPAPWPLFVFITGYGEYAVKAFEVEAVDYVCKPFGKERLSLSLERALRRLSAAEPPPAEGQWVSRLSIREGERIEFLPVEDILWIEAANKYIVVHTDKGSHVLRHTIQGLQHGLDPAKFVRTHRSTLVRKAAVRGLQPLFHGDYIVKLMNGAEVTLSRSFRAAFFRAMSC